MTIWLLALVLLFSTAGLGFRQGAIRAGISFFGILTGALLCVPLGRLLRPMAKAMGLSDPVLVWIIPPLVVFVIISVLFKTGATFLHQKVDVHYKYKTGELRLALWERLNARLGLCVGLLNGTAYLVLIAFLVYALSYWTVQLASSDQDPRGMRFLNRMGRDLESTGFAKVARAVDSLPKNYYEMADFVGLIYRNPLQEARLGSYPAFLGLSQRSEFAELGKDTDFIQLRQTQKPIMAVFNHPRIQAIYNNRDLLKTVWTTTASHLQDLRTYLATGRSPHYDSITILGRWRFNVSAAASLARRVRPNISASEMLKIKRWMTTAFDKTGLIASPEHQVVINNLPPLRMPTPPAQAGPPQTYQGQWQGEGNKYQLSVPNLGELAAGN